MIDKDILETLISLDGMQVMIDLWEAGQLSTLNLFYCCFERASETGARVLLPH